MSTQPRTMSYDQKMQNACPALAQRRRKPNSAPQDANAQNEPNLPPRSPRPTPKMRNEPNLQPGHTPKRAKRTQLPHTNCPTAPCFCETNPISNHQYTFYNLQYTILWPNSPPCCLFYFLLSTFFSRAGKSPRNPIAEVYLNERRWMSNIHNIDNRGRHAARVILG